MFLSIFDHLQKIELQMNGNIHNHDILMMNSQDYNYRHRYSDVDELNLADFLLRRDQYKLL